MDNKNKCHFCGQEANYCDDEWFEGEHIWWCNKCLEDQHNTEESLVGPKTEEFRKTLVLTKKAVLLYKEILDKLEIPFSEKFWPSIYSKNSDENVITFLNNLIDKKKYNMSDVLVFFKKLEKFGLVKAISEDGEQIEIPFSEDMIEKLKGVNLSD